MMFLDFLKSLRIYGLEYFGRYYSLYDGIVTETDDPEQRGRIRVQVPSIFGTGEEISQWVMPYQCDLAGAQSGKFFPPDIGDMVKVGFDHGHIDYPYYVGGYWAQGELDSEFVDGYPLVRGWTFKTGQKILVDSNEGALKIKLINGPTGATVTLDDTDGSEFIEVKHKIGTFLKVDETGKVRVETQNGDFFEIEPEAGDIKVTSSKGGEFLLNADLMTKIEKAVVESSDIKLGSPGASEKAAVASKVDARLAKLESGLQQLNTDFMTFIIAYTSHLHLEVIPPGVPTSPPVVPGIPPLPFIADTSVIASKTVSLKD